MMDALTKPILAIEQTNDGAPPHGPSSVPPAALGSAGGLNRGQRDSYIHPRAKPRAEGSKWITDEGNTALRNSNSALEDLVEEFSARLDRGEQPDVEEFVAAHAEHADRLHRILPTMRMLADLSRGENAGGLAPASPFATDEPPGTLGDFRIIREIGRGGMGVVYEAEHISLNRRVALKILPFAAVLDPRHLQRFKNEALAAAHLDHPNIVEVYGVGCERGVHFYAMRYVEGQTLAEVIEAMRGESRGSVSPRRDPESRRDSATCDDDATNTPLPPRERLGEGVLNPEPRLPAVAGTLNAAEPLTTHNSRLTDTAAVAALSTLRTQHPKDFFRRVAELGIQAAEALDHAHQMGIVHRDIKPSNLMIECSHLAPQRSHLAPRDGASRKAMSNTNSMSHHAERDDYTALNPEPRTLTPLKLWITDFGLARVESDAGAAGLTMTGDLLGTLRYMSPEQAEGRSAILDHRTDIYSLGITLYELLTLQPVFAADDRQTLLRAILDDDPAAPRRLNKSIPSDLETIILKCIRKEAADRYRSAGDLAADLRRLLDQKPIRAKRPSWKHHAWKWTCHHKTGALAGLSVALVIMAVFVALWVRRVQQAQIIAQTVRESLAGAASAIDANDLSLAQAKITELVAWISPQDRLPADLLSEIERLEADVTARSEDAQRFEQFVRLSDQPIISLGDRKSAEVALAFEALKLYHVMERPDWFARLDEMFLEERQRQHVRETAYKLLLLLADDAVRLKNDRPTDQPPTEQASAKTALSYLQKAQSFHEATRGFYYTRAKCYEMLNDVARWEADSQRALTMAGTIGLDHFFAGRDANHYGGTDQASEELYAALRVEPAHFASWHVLATALQTQGRHREAALAYSACILLRPNIAALYTARASSLSEVAENRQAVFDSEKALALDPTNADAYLRRSEVYWRSKNWAKCLADGEEAVRLAPSNAYAKRCLATFLAKKYTPFYDPPRALELAKQALSVSNKNDRNRPLYFACIAEASLRVGDWDAAIEAAQRSHDMPNWFDGFNLFFLAIAHWQRGEHDLARRYYDEAVKFVKKEPHNAEQREFHEEAMALMGIKE